MPVDAEIRKTTRSWIGSVRQLRHLFYVQSHELRLEYAREVLADVERRLGVTPVTREMANERAD